METQDIDKTVAVDASTAEATIIGASVTCPVCRTENAPTEQYCGECGFLLSATPGEEVPALDTTAQPRLTDASGREYVLREGENTVGRESADVLLPDPTVSRSHAKLTIEAGKCWIEDMGSSNGTYEGGVRIQPGEKTEIADGAELKFGSAVLTLVLPAIEEVSETEEPEQPADEAAFEEEVAEAVEPAEETEEVPIEEPEPVEPVAMLVSGADAGISYLIVPGTNAIGRRGTNDIILADDAYVSGSHAEIVADESGFWLTDVGSTNGTTLGGARVEPNVRTALNAGDEIVFGQTALKFEPCESAPEDSSEESLG